MYIKPSKGPCTNTSGRNKLPSGPFSTFTCKDRSLHRLASLLRASMWRAYMPSMWQLSTWSTKLPHPGQKRVSSASRGSPTRIRVRGVHGREVRLMGSSSAPTKAVISVARCCVQGLHGAEAFWCGQLDVHLHLRVDLLLLPFVFVHAESISLVGHCVTSKKECKTMFLHKQMKQKEIKVSFRKYRTACDETKRNYFPRFHFNIPFVRKTERHADRNVFLSPSFVLSAFLSTLRQDRIELQNGLN